MRKLPQFLILASLLAVSQTSFGETPNTELCRKALGQLSEEFRIGAVTSKFDPNNISKILKKNISSEKDAIYINGKLQGDMIELLIVPDPLVQRERNKLARAYGFSNETIEYIELALAQYYENLALTHWSKEETLQRLSQVYRTIQLEKPSVFSRYFFYQTHLVNKSIPEIAKTLGVKESAIYQDLSLLGISVEEAFKTKLSVFQIKNLALVKDLNLSQSLEIYTLIKITEELIDHKWPIERIAQVLGIGEQALRFQLHYKREKNRNIKWDRKVPGEDYDEETLLIALYKSEYETHEIAEWINDVFQTNPASTDYRTAGSVTAKLNRLYGDFSKVFKTPRDVENPVGKGYIKKNGKLQINAAKAFIVENYFIPTEALAQQMGVTVSGLRQFAKRHNIPLSRSQRFESTRHSSGLDAGEILATRTRRKLEYDVKSLRERAKAEATYGPGAKLADDHIKELYEMGLTSTPSYTSKNKQEFNLRAKMTNAYRNPPSTGYRKYLEEKVPKQYWDNITSLENIRKAKDELTESYEEGAGAFYAQQVITGLVALGLNRAPDQFSHIERRLKKAGELSDERIKENRMANLISVHKNKPGFRDYIYQNNYKILYPIFEEMDKRVELAKQYEDPVGAFHAYQVITRLKALGLDRFPIKVDSLARKKLKMTGDLIEEGRVYDQIIRNKNKPGFREYMYRNNHEIFYPMFEEMDKKTDLAKQYEDPVGAFHAYQVITRLKALDLDRFPVKGSSSARKNLKMTADLIEEGNIYEQIVRNKNKSGFREYMYSNDHEIFYPFFKEQKTKKRLAKKYKDVNAAYKAHILIERMIAIGLTNLPRRIRPSKKDKAKLGEKQANKLIEENNLVMLIDIYKKRLDFKTYLIDHGYEDLWLLIVKASKNLDE